MTTDLQLIQDVRSGNKQAFEQLVIRHERFLVKVVVRLTRDLNLAEDVVQEAFLKAYRRLDLFEGRSSFRSWIYQIAMNTARNRFRQGAKETLSLNDPSGEMEIAVESLSEGLLAHADLRKIIQGAIEKLPVRQKQALILRIFDDMSFKEIAEIMDCPYDTAKANYRHALLKLKETFAANQELKSWSQTDKNQEITVNSWVEVEGQ